MSESDNTLESTLVALTLLDETAEGDRDCATHHLHGRSGCARRFCLGEIAPGERINEVHLSRALGVSRTPTRAALHSLAAEGLVDYAHNRGFTRSRIPVGSRVGCAGNPRHP